MCIAIQIGFLDFICSYGCLLGLGNVSWCDGLPGIFRVYISRCRYPIKENLLRVYPKYYPQAKSEVNKSLNMHFFFRLIDQLKTKYTFSRH